MASRSVASQSELAESLEGFDRDVHGDRAYVMASFEEILRPRTGDPGIRIQGRVVQFWRREPGGRWKVARLLTSRSAPDEPDS